MFYEYGFMSSCPIMSWRVWEPVKVLFGGPVGKYYLDSEFYGEVWISRQGAIHVPPFLKLYLGLRYRPAHIHKLRLQIRMGQ